MSGWIPKRSLPALLRAVRATVVMVGLFAITKVWIGNAQMALFAAFGSFATLVLSSFGGTLRDKAVAHGLLALTGSVLLVIGTAVSGSAALAAVVTVPVTFTVFFAGVAGPNAASGATGALLAYVLPAASPGTLSMIPDRLAGWWLASLAGTAAVLLLSPREEADPLRGAVAETADAIGDEIDGALEGRLDPGLQHMITSKRRLQASFNATPYRPVGLATPDEALADVVELLQWCTSLVLDAVREQNDLDVAAAQVDRELLQESANTLHATAALFAGRAAELDLANLRGCRAASLGAVKSLDPSSPGFEKTARISFHAQAIAVAALAIGKGALVAQRLTAAPEMDDSWFAIGERAGARSWNRVSDIAVAAARHATVRSVWVINSLRVALALAVAVAVADLSTVQHGFWVVLGALSVLRTNAASTTSTAFEALSGTAVGVVVGALLLGLIGTSPAALWTALPFAVFIAAYAPGTAPFAVGQAAFTVTVALLFNLLVPVGWSVGLVRVEDVAIGCAVSVLFGAMFWPRGLAAVVGDDLADAFRTGSSFLAEAVGWTAGLRPATPTGEQAAVSAGVRLDDALRGFLTERGSKRLEKEHLWRLVGGSLRLRLTAHAVAELPQDPIALASARDALERRTRTLIDWYDGLATLVDRPAHQPAATLEPPIFGPDTVVTAGSGSHYGVWLCEHLDHLAEHLGDMIEPATRLAALRRAPWWK